MALERKDIIAAAIDLLDEVGIDKLSTRALANRLGVAQPALYWHFRSKGDLLDALNEEMLRRHHERRMPRPGESWDAFLLAHARSMRQALLAVRDGARISAGTRPTPVQFVEAEQHLRLLVDAGFAPQTALHVSMGLARFVVGFVLEEQGEREREAAEGTANGALDELKDLPLLAEAVQSLLDEGTINTESAFENGLSFFLDGARLSLAARHK